MEPYVLLDPRQRALYRDVMQESYETLMALGKEAFSLAFVSSSQCAPHPNHPRGLDFL